jgi:O-antigen/teichoic acid export membrane protein
VLAAAPGQRIAVVTHGGVIRYLLCHFLGSGFSEVKLTIICLIPGILAIASGMIFSHYFSGTGKPHFNTIGSGIGLVAIVSAGYLLIPRYGLAGAGIATSFSYMISLIFQLVLFVYQTKTPFSEFMINRNDMMQLKNFVIPQKKKTNLS